MKLTYKKVLPDGSHIAYLVFDSCYRLERVHHEAFYTS